jgi:acetylglutamate kinase
MLANLIELGIVPVMAPLSYSKQYGMLNTNADTIAAETAKGLSKHYETTLIYCFEKKGVLYDETDDNSVIPSITPALFEQYKKEGIIQGGMIPKLENAFNALHAGVSKVIITQASELGNNSGTVVTLE